MAAILNGVADSQKIDSFQVDGLTGVKDSLAYKVNEIERHIHSRGRWCGISGDQSGNDWCADTLSPFQAISGANAYGSDANDEAKVLGTADTPIISGSAKFDLHRFLIVDVSADTPYKLRLVYGAGTMADAITALQYTEVMVMSDVTNPQRSSGTPFTLQVGRLDAGTKVWVQAWNVTDNATIDFLIEIHEYEG